MGLFAIGWELWFDLSSITVGGNSTYEQFWSGFDLCRLNMYIIGVFLLLRKIDWIKWVVATALWGGASSLFNHYNNSAIVHSLFTHAIILPTFPAFAITLAKTNYSFKSYVYAHFFNWTVVLFLIATNYGFDRHAGELREDHLADNVLVGWAPYGLRMILWILVVMFVEFCYFLLFRYVYWQSYEPKSFKRKLFGIGKLQVNIYERQTGFWTAFTIDFKRSLTQIPLGPKNTYIALSKNIQKNYAFSVETFLLFKNKLGKGK